MTGDGLLLLAGYVATDRVAARYYTGSWLGQPSDLADDDE